MIRKLEQDRIAADLSAVQSLISDMRPSDFLSRMSLENRLEELRSLFDASSASVESRAAASLFFGGSPVVNSEGVESTFGGKAIGFFQEIVSEFNAAKSTVLGERGRPPSLARSVLHVTGVVHGSFGFEFRELGDPVLFDSQLKESVEEAVQVISAFDEPNDDKFDLSILNVDPRVISTIKQFFAMMSASGASLRIVSDSIDKSFDAPTIIRIAERATTETITERQSTMHGRLVGFLPEHRNFEYRTNEGLLVFGKTDRTMPQTEIDQLIRVWFETPSIATLNIRETTKQGKPPRFGYTLVGLRKQAE